MQVTQDKGHTLFIAKCVLILYALYKTIFISVDTP